MTLKSLPFILFAVVALAVSPALAKTSTADFVKKAGIANKFEIDSSKLALQQSQDDNVKAFAQQMIDDHTKAGDAFNQALQSTKPPMAAPTDLDSSHQKDIDKLSKLQASDFDKKYIKLQVSAHKDAVKLFSDYAKKGDDASLKNFASTTLPTLQQHLDHINQLQKDYGKKQASAK